MSASISTPRSSGASFVEARRFQKSIGGSPTNVAVAAARLGHRAAVITKVGDDELGGYVRTALADSFGVDTRFVGTHPTLKTPLVIAALDPPEEPQFVFYREPAAPDSTILPGEVDLGIVREVPILWVSAGALAVEPSRGTVRTMLEDAAAATTPFSISITDRHSGPSRQRPARRSASPSRRPRSRSATARSARSPSAPSDPEAAAGALLERGVEIAIVKLGGNGVLVATADERHVVAPLQVDVVCALGAGDAFGGALCHALLVGMSPPEAVDSQTRPGAIVASRLLCADAMPSEPEVRALLEASPCPELSCSSRPAPLPTATTRCS